MKTGHGKNDKQQNPAIKKKKTGVRLVLIHRSEGNCGWHYGVRRASIDNRNRGQRGRAEQGGADSRHRIELAGCGGAERRSEKGGQGRSNNMPTCQLVRIRKGMEYQVREPSLHLDDQIGLAS